MSEPDSPTECCSERAIVLMESTSTQTKTHTDELDQVKDAAEKLAHQLQTAQELLELKEVGLLIPSIINRHSYKPTTW